MNGKLPAVPGPTPIAYIDKSLETTQGNVPLVGSKRRRRVKVGPRRPHHDLFRQMGDLYSLIYSKSPYRLERNARFFWRNALMGRFSSTLIVSGLVLTVFLVPARAETVIPMKGQSPEQIQADIAACQVQAQGSTSQTSSGAATTNTTPPAQQGGRLRGAAAGAAAGAASAEVRGRRHDEVYDNIDDDTKQDYRQNQAHDAAVAGAVIGGSRQRQDRRQAAQQQQEQPVTATPATQEEYVGCMSGKGYTITP
jgi:hypothetical protein